MAPRRSTSIAQHVTAIGLIHARPDVGTSDFGEWAGDWCAINTAGYPARQRFTRTSVQCSNVQQSLWPSASTGDRTHRGHDVVAANYAKRTAARSTTAATLHGQRLGSSRIHAATKFTVHRRSTITFNTFRSSSYGADEHAQWLHAQQQSTVVGKFDTFVHHIATSARPIQFVRIDQQQQFRQSHTGRFAHDAVGARAEQTFARLSTRRDHQIENETSNAEESWIRAKLSIETIASTPRTGKNESSIELRSGNGSQRIE